MKIPEGSRCDIAALFRQALSDKPFGRQYQLRPGLHYAWGFNHWLTTLRQSLLTDSPVNRDKVVPRLSSVNRNSEKD